VRTGRGTRPAGEGGRGGPAAAGRVYNVAEPTAHTEAEWVARIGAAVAWGGEIVAVPGGKLPVPLNTAQDLAVDTTRIRAELGYREVVDPGGALRGTVEWVIDGGPYALVRHPGYAGGSLLFLGTALCLGSAWALIPAGLASALLVLRTRWEDRTLRAELPGYEEYTQRVRHRLLPGVW
jgi:Phospholipid methyltransferase